VPGAQNGAETVAEGSEFLVVLSTSAVLKHVLPTSLLVTL